MVRWLVWCALALVAGCSDDSSPARATGGASGAAGSGGSSAGAAGSGGAAGTSGASGASGSAGAAGAAGVPSCHGDSAKWSEITASPIACSTNSDCCVVFSPCTGDAQVVAQEDFADAPAALPYCDAMCTDCARPPVEVVCVGGQCGLAPVNPAQAEPDDTENRCGEDVPMTVGTPLEHISCGG